MTKEELINQLKSAIESPCPADKQVACGMAITWLEKNTDKEPQGLDEAAEEFRKNDDAKYPCDQCLVNSFKYGAKWMAEQGYTTDGLVICDEKLTHGYKDIVMSIPESLNIGDKVIVQIRRK